MCVEEELGIEILEVWVRRENGWMEDFMDRVFAFREKFMKNSLKFRKLKS